MNLLRLSLLLMGLMLLSSALADGPAISAETTLQLLYLDDAEARVLASQGCGEDVRCLLEGRYAEDEKAQALVLRLYDRMGSVVGVEEPDTREVGWRGTITFEPALPTGKKKRKHLTWVVESLEDIDDFFAALASHTETPLPYRWQGLELRFFTTPERTTPSAYAWSWKVAYNVRGSLMKSKRRVRETLFHELFHLNDQEHDDWSVRELTPIFDRIVERCTQEDGELSTRCLKPYAPGKTKVKGGTYYAFEPGNGVGEYAAELALRYFLEQRAQILDTKKKPKPFKCATEDNAEAWALLTEAFFAGVDLVPDCE